MRITTQMLNESAKKAGIPINKKSLLNYMNSDGNNNLLLKTMNKRKTAAVDVKSKAKYDELDKVADKLTQSSLLLLQKGEGSLFAEAKSSGNNEKILESIKTMFDNYGGTMKALTNASGTLNDFYRRMMKEAVDEVSGSLEKVGINFSKDATSCVDMNKLKDTDIETLEKMFGSDSNLMNKLHFIATKISDNAKANVESLSNKYGANGNIYSANSGGKYNFWG